MGALLKLFRGWEVIPRPLLFTIVFALPLTVVTFAVLMGGYALAHATGDAPAATVLWYMAMACMMLAGVDVILLIGVLGARALGTPEQRRDREEP